MIRLRAEMKVPGDAWLQFEVAAQDTDNSLLIQTAYFAPKGLAGFLYWYLLYPIHSLVFSGLINALAERSIARAGEVIQVEYPDTLDSAVRVPVESRAEIKRRSN
jgi:hypothetical protein